MTDSVQVAADGEMLHAHQLGDMVEVIKDVIDGYRLSAADQEANEWNSHEAATLGQSADGVIRLGAEVAGDERTTGSMSKEYRLIRSLQCIQGGLVPAMRQIDTHADLLH